jgi:hypothetical protein
MARPRSKPDPAHVSVLTAIGLYSTQVRAAQRKRDNAMAVAFERGVPVIHVARAAGISAQAARMWRDRRRQPASA